MQIVDLTELETKRSTEWDGKERTLYKRYCGLCGNKLWRPRSGIREINYCSRDCSAKARQKRIIFVCEYCGKETERPIGKLNRSKHKKYFCSRECKDLAQRLNTPQSVVEIHPDHYGLGNSKWNYRTRALKKYGIHCQQCGYKNDERMLDVHHIDSDRSNNELDNLVVLCVWCHAFRTRNIEPHNWNGSI